MGPDEDKVNDEEEASTEVPAEEGAEEQPWKAKTDEDDKAEDDEGDEAAAA